jgi:hypothetical protein
MLRREAAAAQTGAPAALSQTFWDLSRLSICPTETVRCLLCTGTPEHVAATREDAALESAADAPPPDGGHVSSSAGALEVRLILRQLS